MLRAVVMGSSIFQCFYNVSTIYLFYRKSRNKIKSRQPEERSCPNVEASAGGSERGYGQTLDEAGKAAPLGIPDSEPTSL